MQVGAYHKASGPAAINQTACLQRSLPLPAYNCVRDVLVFDEQMRPQRRAACHLFRNNTRAKKPKQNAGLTKVEHGNVIVRQKRANL